MARVPDDELARLKAEVSLERLAESAGVELRRHGADLVGLCPFHDDRDPSLVITPGKNLWHCFGACAAGGSVIDWVMRAEGVSFRHAVELLRTGAPISISASGPPRRGTVRRLPAPVDESLDDAAVLDRVVGFYSQTLRESAEALGWLEARRIGHPDAIERFDLGFSNRTLGYRLPDRQRRAGAELRGRLQTLGVYRASGHEHFAGSVVFPIRDGHGNVVEIYGRKVGEHLRAGTPAHLYLPGPHRGVWNIEALAAGDEVVVAESIIDALSLWCAGFRHVTCAYGTEGFGDEHHQALVDARIRRVLIAFDADDAGDHAARRLGERLLGAGVECFRVRPRPATTSTTSP